MILVELERIAGFPTLAFHRVEVLPADEPDPWTYDDLEGERFFDDDEGEAA